MVTPEWDAEDVGTAFAQQVLGAMAPVDDITSTGDGGERPFIMGKVLCGDRMVGVAMGRIRDFYHKKMISLASVEKDLAVEGTELELLWGTIPETQVRIRAKVAAFPYYNEEWRNEICNVMAMVPERPYL